MRRRALDLKRKYNLTNEQIKNDLLISRKAILTYEAYYIQLGDTSSPSQIWGRKPKRKGYSSSDLRALIDVFMSEARTLYEAKIALVFETGRSFPEWTLFRMVLEILHSRKKASIAAHSCDLVLVAIHHTSLIGIARKKLKSGDQMHIESRCSNYYYGCCFRGTPVQHRGAFVRRNRAYVIGACGSRGFLAHAIKHGSVTKHNFVYSLFFVTFGVFEEGDEYVLDDAAIHKGPIIETVLTMIGASLFWLPPCFPQGNPIEIA